MRRYFYSSPPIIAKWLEKNAFAKSLEDSIYRSTFLAALRSNQQKQWSELREQVLSMTIGQQQQYCSNAHLQAVFNQFHWLYRCSQGRSMIVDATQNSSATDLVDPDKFPIWDLKYYTPIYKSLWGHCLPQLRYHLGFQPIIRDSCVEHPASGRGVYAILPLHKKKIEVGEFIGLVPGKVFPSFQDFKTVSLKSKKQYERPPQHLHFPTGKILQLGDVSGSSWTMGASSLTMEDEAAQPKVDGTYHNPYAFGHMINHPPAGYEANVCFSQMTISEKYLPKYLRRYLPYEYALTPKKEVTLFGIVAVREIQHKEELFVNYNESHIYPIDDVPQWLIPPPEFSPITKFLRKGEYELAESAYWNFIEGKAMTKNKQLWQKYKQQTVLRPGEVQYEDQKSKYRALKVRLQDDNEYEHM